MMKRFLILSACLFLGTACSQGRRTSPVDNQAKQAEKKLEEVVPTEGDKTQANGEPKPDVIATVTVKTVTPTAVCKKEDKNEIESEISKIQKSTYPKITREFQAGGKAMPNKVSATRHLTDALKLAEEAHADCTQYEKTVDIAKCEIADVKLAAEKLSLSCTRIAHTKTKIEAAIEKLK